VWQIGKKKPYATLAVRDCARSLAEVSPPETTTKNEARRAAAGLRNATICSQKIRRNGAPNAKWAKDVRQQEVNDYGISLIGSLLRRIPLFDDALWLWRAYTSRRV
jgi:hypothetical protein